LRMKGVFFLVKMEKQSPAIDKLKLQVVQYSRILGRSLENQESAA
jgi:hypothetical protein